MRATRHTSIPAVLLLTLSAACAPAATDGGRYLAPPTVRPGVVEVVNDSPEDIVLYVVRDGVRHRMGRVSRMEIAEFRLPAPGERASYQMSLIAEPVGTGRPFATAPLLWHPGQSLRGRVGRSGFTPTFDVVLR